MHRIHTTIAAMVALTAVAIAQSPLSTTFLNNNAANAAGGTGVYFDLTVNVSLLVTKLELNCNSPIGTNGTINVYSTPTTYVGNVQTPALWTQIGTGSVTAAGVGNPTQCTLTTPFVLLPGTYGIALQHLGLVAAYTNGTGANQTWVNAEVTLVGGASQNVCFSAANPFTPRVWNGRIHYTVTDPTWAQAIPYGDGCYDRPVSFHETFLGATFDLAGSTTTTNSILLQPLTPPTIGYAVVAGSNQWFTPVAANLGLADDGVSGPLVMPFSFSYAGGSTTTVFACSNGFVWLQPNNNTYYRPVVGQLLTMGPRLCPMWMDLNPILGGAITFDVDPGNQAAYVTWTNVPEYQQPATQNTFQVAIFANGNVEYRWRAVANVNAPGLVGWSPGLAANDPGIVDISVAMPFVTGDGTKPLTLRASARPQLGATIQLVTSEIPNGTAAGFMIGSFTQHLPGISLLSLGMPGCTQSVGFDAVSLILPTSSSHNHPFSIPSSVGFDGLHVFWQSATLSAGFNPLGVLASNGLDVRLGSQ